MFARTDGKVLILIMLMAVILALGGALAYYYLSGRPDYPAGTYVTDVNNTKVLVRSNPKMAVQIIATPPEQQAVSSSGEVAGQGGAQGDPTPVIAPTLPPDPTPVVVPTLVPTPTPKLCIKFVEYQVVSGDTLYSISNKYNTTIALMARFGVDATDIVPGTVVDIAVANEDCCTGTGNQAYVIREGDTLSTIAVKCGTTVNTLKQINGFGDVYRLDETNVICIPPQPQG